MQQVAVGWLVLQLTNSAFTVGLVMMLGGLPMSLFTLYGGVVADRVNKLRFLVVLQGLMLLVAVGLAVLTLADSVTIGWIMVLVAGQGVLIAFEVPTRQAFVIEMVGKNDLMHAIALNSSVFNATRVIGPAAAGALISTVGIGTTFVVNAVSFLAVLAALLFMRFPPGALAPANVNAASAFREGMRFVVGRPSPRRLMVMTGIMSVFGGSFVVMLPVFARDAVHVGAEGYGVLVASVGVGALAGALFLAWFGSHAPRHRLVYGSAGILGVLLVMVGFTPWFWVAAFILAAAGAALILTYVSINTMLQIQAPDDLRGRVMGFYAFMALGMAPLGALQIGWLSEVLGVRAAMAIGGVLCSIGAAALWYHRRRSRRRHPGDESV